MFLLSIILSLILQAQQEKTTAIILDENKPVIILSQKEAEIKYQELVKHNTDEKLFAALTIALGKIPDTVFCSLHKLCISHQQIEQLTNSK